MILIRHPVTAAPPGLCYGRTDPGLGPAAKAQIASVLKDLGAVSSVLSSPAPRCLALAHSIADARSLPLTTDPRLAEMDFGRWEGCFWSEIPRVESDPWADDPWSVAPPGGETFAAVSARVADALADAAAGAVVVTHAGVIRAARMILEGASFCHVFAEAVPYAQPIRMDRCAA